eukprot:3264390-Amphidinium_carterae.1
MASAIERLQRGGGQASDEEDIDSILRGAQARLDEPDGKSGGAKGIQALLRLNRAVERQPARWSQALDESAWRALGCN